MRPGMTTLSARLVTILLVVGPWSASPATAQAPSTRSYAIPNHGMLELVVPARWKDSVRQPPPGQPPTITFLPPSGDQFQLLVMPLWHPQGKVGFNSPRNIRAVVEQQGQKMLAHAVEKTLVLEELNGKEATGLHYALTQRAPGEYAYLTQGAVGVGDLMLTFTMVLKTKDAPERRAALEMLRSASQKLRKGN